MYKDDSLLETHFQHCCVKGLVNIDRSSCPSEIYGRLREKGDIHKYSRIWGNLWDRDKLKLRYLNNPGIISSSCVMHLE